MDRFQLIQMLLTKEEQANAAYIAGEIDRDGWAKEITDVDDKLSVLGIRLASALTGKPAAKF